jgi:hypothetical protein
MPTVLKLARTAGDADDEGEGEGEGDGEGEGEGEGDDDGAATIAVVFALACEPPLLVTLTEITSWPVLTYVWLPEIPKPPPGAAVIEPAETVPSPQLIVALSSDATPSGLASVRCATKAVNAVPGTALTGTPVAVSGASLTVTVNWPLPLNDTPAHDAVKLTLPAYVP